VEVCSLSRRIMSQPVSGPLQSGIRFFHDPLPAPPSDPLAVHLPVAWRRYGLTLFHINDTSGLGSAFPPVACRSRPPIYKRESKLHAFWPEPVSAFGSSTLTMFISSSLTLTNTTQPQPPRHMRLRHSLTPSRFRVALRRGTLVPGASHNRITPDACPGRLLLAKQQVSSLVA